jgi:hypothetical protein
MPVTQIEIIHKSKIGYQIQERYQKEISAVEKLGFGNMIHTREVTFPFSFLVFFWLYPYLKYKKEIFHIEKPLRYVTLAPLLFNNELDSYCGVFGLGTRFVTAFVDGIVIISCTYPFASYSKPDLKIYKYSPEEQAAAINDVWEQHQERILSIERKGFETDHLLSVDKYEEYMQRDDRAMLGY